MEIKTVGLIGLGAVGALYAERLLSSGADLRVIVDEARRKRYTREGIYINAARIDFPYVTPAQAEPVDLLLIVTKEGGLRSAMETASIASPAARNARVLAPVPRHSPRKMPTTEENSTLAPISTAKPM